MSIINERTGLREGWNEHFNIPLVHQRGLGSLRFGRQNTAIHSAPLGGGRSLDFYARLGPSNEMLVSLHGALSPTKPLYPRFERVSSLRHATPAAMAFADPTMKLGLNRSV